jgi:hypothetical protein
LPGVSFMRILLNTNEDECLEVLSIVNQRAGKFVDYEGQTWVKSAFGPRPPDCLSVTGVTERNAAAS